MVTIKRKTKIQQVDEKMQTFIEKLSNGDVIKVYYKLSSGKYISHGLYTVHGIMLVKFGGSLASPDLSLDDLIKFDKVERPTEYKSRQGDTIPQNKPYIKWEKSIFNIRRGDVIFYYETWEDMTKTEILASQTTGLAVYYNTASYWEEVEQ